MKLLHRSETVGWATVALCTAIAGGNCLFTGEIALGAVLLVFANLAIACLMWLLRQKDSE